MDTEETPQQHSGGIYNYFQGATINNLVINGNMTKSGTENFDNGGHEKPERPKATEEQIAHALLSVTGKKNVLNNYQMWLGACCLLMGKYDFPKRLESCCEKIAALPYGNERLPLECKYESIRKFAYMRFVREDVDTWETYSPREEEQKLFYACLKVKQELDKAIRREKGENL